MLTAKHVKDRLSKAQDSIGLTEREVKRIVFSDESKFNLLYSDGKASVWREPGSRLKKANVTETKKFGGGSVTVWACFSYYGIGRLTFIDGIMDAPKYVSILASCLPPSLGSMGISEFIFQQDNDSKHTAKLTKRFLWNRGINKQKKWRPMLVGNSALPNPQTLCVRRPWGWVG